MTIKENEQVNTEAALEALLQQARQLDTAAAERIAATRRAIQRSFNPHWESAIEKLRRAGADREWNQAVASLGRILMSRDLGQHVRFAAYDAALALIVRDQLSQLEFQSLYGAWAAGAPEHLVAVL